jgi:indole-3-glycerol phosphate synthase
MSRSRRSSAHERADHPRHDRCPPQAGCCRGEGVRLSQAQLSSRIAGAPEPIDFADRLRRDNPMAVIAEVKRASPSKGDIAPGLDAVAQAMKYATGGAAGISVLTEPTWFKGTLADMAGVRAAIDSMGAARPAVLRKDFIIDEYQVIEGRVHGADSVLLIVASLTDERLAALMDCSRDLGMEPLVEVNNSEEMQRALASGASVIGINNRDLRTFNVDLGTTDRLAGMVGGSALTGRAQRHQYAGRRRALPGGRRRRSAGRRVAHAGGGPGGKNTGTARPGGANLNSRLISAPPCLRGDLP